MKKTIQLGSIVTAIILLSTNAYSETVDARSAALGGTTLGQANNAFAPLRNPAAMTEIGWGNVILPLSPALTIGNTSKPISSFTSLLGNKDIGSASLDLASGFFGSENSRLEVQSILPIIGFSGAPFNDFSIMGKPIALGINLWGRAVSTANFNSSKGIGQLISNTPLLFNSFTDLQKQSNNIGSSFSNITSINFPNLQNVNPTNKDQVDAVITEVEQFQNNTLKPLINTSDIAITAINKATSDLKNILNNLDDISKNNQSGKSTFVADGHAVVAVSGASQVFNNDFMNVSLGLNLKGFFFPANMNYSSFTGANNTNPLINIIGGNQGANKLLPITINTDIQTGPFKSISDIKSIVDTKLTPVVQTANELLNTAKVLDTQITTVIPKAKENALNVFSDAPAIQGTVNSLISQSNSVRSTITNDFSRTLISDIQGSLNNDLKDVKINFSQMTDVAPFGFGMDIGAQARIMDNIVLGLVLENPLVLWPAKIKNNQMTFNQDKLQSSIGQSNIQMTDLFNIIEDKNPQSTNYNLSEPFAIRFGGSYGLGKLTPYLANTTVLADVEQVFNGRPFAAHLGLEKGWTFGTNAVFARIGTQLGGLGNMFTLGLGAKGGPFNISVGYGASNLFSPTGGNNALLALSTSLSF